MLITYNIIPATIKKQKQKIGSQSLQITYQSKLKREKTQLKNPRVFIIISRNEAK